MRSGGLAVKSRVHAAGNKTCAPMLKNIKLRCYQQLPLGPKLTICKHGCPYSIHISKVPLFGASVDPLWWNRVLIISVCKGMCACMRAEQHLRGKCMRASIFVDFLLRAVISCTWAQMHAHAHECVQACVHLRACVCVYECAAGGARWCVQLRVETCACARACACGR